MITSYEQFVPIVMGCGSMLRTGLKVRELGCKKVLVTHGKNLKKTGYVDILVENLESAGIKAVCFDGVQPDPPDTMVEEAAEFARKEKIDGIVAIGGGSSMDTAKAINVLINNEPPIIQYLGVQKNLNPGVPLICIPTTSGTGSEVTTMTVITCTSLNKKDSVLSPVCLPTLAILDPELTLGLSPRMTAITALDALAHAVESLTGGQANPLSDALAREAIRLIAKWLPVAYNDGSNIKARENLMYASTFAGMAFTNALVHIGHSIAHVLGAQFDIPHGMACAIAIPEVIEYAAKTETEKVKMICECFGIEIDENADYEIIGATAKKTLRTFIKSVGIPNLKELGISLEDTLNIAPLVTQDSGFAIAPYRITASKVAEMLKSAYDA